MRVERRQELHDLLEARTSRQSGEALGELLTAAQVPAAPVNELATTLEHPLALERRPTLSPADGDDRRAVRLPFEEPGAEIRWPPALGADTESVLREAGLDQSLIDRVTAGKMASA
jgi:crotonobetainyl-CoA:carnitine CoA-transferase CaiB-like acyl-CoA transferase